MADSPMDNAVAQLLEAWRTDNRINLFLVGHGLAKADRYAIWNWEKV